jgi:hypothetical protein
MFSVMTWNLENFERPAANAKQAVKDRHARKLQQITELIFSAGPELVGVQEVLADPKDLAPRVFEDLLAALGPGWSGCLSRRPDPRGIRVGWLARGQLSDPTEVAVYPHQVPATTIDDDNNQITAITAAKRGALAVTYTRTDGLVVQALTAHLKSKLLTFPGRDPDHPQFDTAMRPSGPLCPVRPGPAGRRGRHHPGLGHRPAARPGTATPRAGLRRPERHPPGRHHPGPAWASRFPAGHRRVQTAGRGRRQPAVEPGPQDARR